MNLGVSSDFLGALDYFENTGLTALNALVGDPPRLTDPFYLLSVASHDDPKTFNPRRPTGLHAHLAVGNVTWEEFESLLSAWPGYVASNAKRSMKGQEWMALHYVASQDPRTGDPLLDNFEPGRKRLPLRHIVDQGRGQGHLCPPTFSPGLDDIVNRFRSRLAWRNKAARKGAAR